MAMVNAILLKPLDGGVIGSQREFSKADFDRLKAQNAVKAAPAKKAAGKPANKAKGAPANKSGEQKEGSE